MESDSLLKQLDAIQANADSLTKGAVARLEPAIASGRAPTATPVPPRAATSMTTKLALSVDDGSLAKMKQLLDAEVAAGHKARDDGRTRISAAGLDYAASAEALKVLFKAQGPDRLANLVATLTGCLGGDPAQLPLCISAGELLAETIANAILSSVDARINQDLTGKAQAWADAAEAMKGELQFHAARATNILDKMMIAIRL